MVVCYHQMGIMGKIAEPDGNIFVLILSPNSEITQKNQRGNNQRSWSSVGQSRTMEKLHSQTHRKLLPMVDMAHFAATARLMSTMTHTQKLLLTTDTSTWRILSEYKTAQKLGI